MKRKTSFFYSVFSLFSVILIMLGAVPDLALALDGQFVAGSDPSNSTPHADLKIDKLSIDPEFPRPNSDVMISAVIKNLGNAYSNPTYLILTIEGLSSLMYSMPIAPGAEASFSKTWTTPDKEDTVIIHASIDGVDNSEKEIPIPVQNPRPDLTVQDIVPEPVNPQEGQPVNFVVKVINQGTAPSPEALASYFINGVPGQNLNIPALIAGTGTDVPFSLPPEQVIGGDLKVKVLVDSGGTVLESNEINNEFLKNIKVKGLPSDLIVESINFYPEAPNVGDNITFTASVRNIGSGTSAASNLRYYINSTGEASTTFTSDTRYVNALPAGEAAQIPFFFVPQNGGSIDATAVIDPDASIAETDEMNNRRTIIVTVTNESSSGSGGGGSSSGSSSGGSSSSHSRSSSGSGSSFSKEPAVNVASRELATRNVMSGFHVRYDFQQKNTCVIYFEYDPIRTYLKTTTTVEDLKSKSTFVSKNPPGRVYRNFNTWLGDSGGGSPTVLKNGVIGFRVEKSWINKFNVNKSLITLLRFDKDWQVLNTEEVGNDNNYIYFKADTPGFSFFAISENIKNSNLSNSKLPKIGTDQSAGKKTIGKSGKLDAQEVRDLAKIFMTLSLPIFLILAGYLLVKKKI